MAGKLAKGPSKSGPVTKNTPSVVCGAITVPSMVERGYSLRKLGGHLGNVGYAKPRQSPHTGRSRMGVIWEMSITLWERT